MNINGNDRQKWPPEPNPDPDLKCDTCLYFIPLAEFAVPHEPEDEKDFTGFCRHNYHKWMMQTNTACIRYRDKKKVIEGYAKKADSSASKGR